MTPLATTERHRTRQLSMTARVLRKLVPWLNVMRDIPPSEWVLRVAPLVADGREDSQLAAYSYFREVKQAATGELEIPTYEEVRTDPDLRRVQTSLLVTGPYTYTKRLAEGDPEPLALRKAQSAASGAATRHVLDGSRRLIREAARADQTARGWVRVTDGDPCAFCAMLATRGFAAMRGDDGLYRSRETALFVQDGSRGTQLPGEKYHDNCGCTVMPVFGRDFTLPPDAERWDKLYAESTKGVSGKAKLKAFRKAYDDSRKSSGG